MNKFLGMLFVLAFGILSASAGVFEHGQKLENIINKIPSFGNTECRFYQEKFMESSQITLKSSGDFKYEKDKGVTFYTTEPIKSTVSYTSREYRQINNIINAISNKSYSKIEKDFKFYFTQNAQEWALGMTPKKESPSYNYLKSIEIEGNQNMITKMIIISADGVRTTIWFKK